MRYDLAAMRAEIREDEAVSQRKNRKISQDDIRNLVALKGGPIKKKRRRKR
jgi:hypothetical protein